MIDVIRALSGRGTGSLRQRLIVRLLGAVTLVALLASAIAWYMALRFANDVLDRWIADSAVALSQLVRTDGATVRLDLPPEAEHMLASDQHDRILWRVTTLDGTFVAGHRSLPSVETPPPGSAPRCFDARFDGNATRVAAYRPIGQPFVVAVADPPPPPRRAARWVDRPPPASRCRRSGRRNSAVRIRAGASRPRAGCGGPPRRCHRAWLRARGCGRAGRRPACARPRVAGRAARSRHRCGPVATGPPRCRRSSGRARRLRNAAPCTRRSRWRAARPASPRRAA